MAAPLPDDWQADILRFWFGLDPDQWWKADPAIDEDTRQRFLERWSQKRQLPAHCFLGHPLTALAAVLLFDQFPRNMFRGHADQYSTDHLALAVAREAIERGFDDALAKEEKVFLYMPFEHSEHIADQRRSMALFTALGDDFYIGFARRHLEVIERFGRFPHRNAILGRTPRPGEAEASEAPW